MERASSDRMAELFERVSNWGRWGDDDERGALNLITADRVARAGALVTGGRVVSCGRDLPTTPSADNPIPVQHMMLAAGDCLDNAAMPGFEQTTDFLGVACHGMGISHIDALCHMFVGGRMYNGFGASEVRSTGALRNSIAAAAGGIVGRGVLLDIPRLRGSRYLDPDTAVTPDELTAAESAAGITVGPGDILIVATGRDARQADAGAPAGIAGLDPECLPWLRDRDVAVLGSDGISDVIPPNAAARWPFPVHQCGITAIGLHLLDNLALSELAEVCADEDRWEFLFMVGPLRASRATGSPVNPVAVF
jgi:kynurenine formamidase